MKFSRLIAIAALSAASAAPAIPAQSSELQDQYLSHVATCLQLLFTDPVEQAAECGTGNGATERAQTTITFPEDEKEDCPVPALSILAEPDCEPEIIG